MKTTYKNLILLFLIIAIVPELNGQVKDQQTVNLKYKHSLGVGAGFTTGYGISYKYTPEKLGLQVTFAPYMDDTKTLISVGFGVIWNIIESEKTNFFLYQSNHYYKKEYKQLTNEHYFISYGDDDEYFNNGLGIGIELIVFDRISFNLMGGYAAYENFKKLSLTGETGLYYKF